MKTKIFKLTIALFLLMILSLGLIGCKDPAQSGEKPIEWTTVKYSDLDNWLQNSASESEVNYIKITEIPKIDLQGVFRPGYGHKRSALAKKIKNGRKKVFIQLALENDEKLEEIPDACFYLIKELIGIKFPKTLKKISKGPFDDCKSLEFLDFSEASNLTHIQGNAFNGCTSLKHVDLSKTKLGRFEGNMFHTCPSLESLNFSGLTSLVEVQYVNSAKNLKSIDFSGCANLLKIFDYSFHDLKKLKSINFSGCYRLQRIEEYAFEGCTEIENIDISDSTEFKEIGEKAFYGCVKATVKLPDVDINTFKLEQQKQQFGDYTNNEDFACKLVLYPEENSAMERKIKKTFKDADADYINKKVQSYY